jgi:oxepin-CoA hydrolase/3-oxo-5,6-dehydrosuberyl-CoA semialdehyde dehydrogenase
MNPILQSFIGGRWIGSQAAAPLLSAINGEVVTHTHADSLDFAEALDYARRTGLAGMMAMDFQQRANALKALA